MTAKFTNDCFTKLWTANIVKRFTHQYVCVLSTVVTQISANLE